MTATKEKKAAPKKIKVTSGEKPKAIRNSPAVILKNRISDLEAFDAAYLAKRAKKVELIQKLQLRVAAPEPSKDEVVSALKEGKTPEQIKAEIKRLVGLQKKLGTMSAEEQAELLSEVEEIDEEIVEA